MPTVTLERETLERAVSALTDGGPPTQLITALRAALAAQPAVPPPHVDYPCRTDGRCQYAIDSGAEGLGHCPAGKCVMPPAPAAVPPEPLTDERLLELAREHAPVVYTNRHFPDAPAFSFPTGKLLEFARAIERAHGIGDKP